MIKTPFHYEKIDYPNKEISIRLTVPLPWGDFRILWEYENLDELIELALIKKALDSAIKPGHVPHRYELILPYLPFSRMDRQEKGFSFSLDWFCSEINKMEFLTVNIVDPHSDVSHALLKNCYITYQHEIFEPYFKNKSDFFLVCPDSGALKKIEKLASLVNPMNIVFCTKQRDFNTGDIVKTTIYYDSLDGKDCYIVDDICDGGKTFIEIAKILKERGAGKIILMVSHGFFTKGLSVFDGLIDEIYTRKGQIK